MTLLRVGLWAILVLAATTACARSRRAPPPGGGVAGSGQEAGAGGIDAQGGSSGTAGGKGGSAGSVADAGEAGGPSGGASSGTGGSAGRGGSAARGGTAGSDEPGEAGGPGAAGEGGGGGVDGIDTVREINDAQWAAFCRMLFSCPMIESDEVPGFRAALRDEATCRATFQGVVTGRSGVADLGEAVDAGRVVLQLDELPACLEAWSSCDFFPERRAADGLCRLVYAGTQAMGEACSRDEECVVGRCVVSDACPGTCAPLAGAGETCENDQDCDSSTGRSSCELQGSNLPDACFVRTPSPPVGEGEECWEFSDEMEDPQPCATGLWCQGDGIYNAPPGSSPGYEYRKGVCRSTPIPAGEACDNDEDVCELGYACRRVAEDSEEQTCTPLRIIDDVGEPCGLGIGFCNPFERLECVSGYCESTTDGLEGSSCRPMEFLGYRPCEPGLVCVVTGMDDPITPETAQTCLPPRAAGEACRRHTECASETCGTDNRCADRFCESARQWF